MQARNVLYAAVGAPVVAARKMSDQMSAWRTKVNKETAGYTEAAEKTLNSWAAEGEKVVARISDGAVVEEITQKVDLDQAKEQVSKLRDQLEDMLETWRQSFRPEDKAPAAADVKATPAAAKAASTKTTSSKTTAAKKPAAKTTAAKKPAAKKTAASSTTRKAAAKTTSAAKATKVS